MYFAQRLILEHSVSGVGNLPPHVILKCYSSSKLDRKWAQISTQINAGVSRLYNAYTTSAGGLIAINLMQGD